jgi:alkylhydroperoxidase/carboxymuconolactone decarboxylase family protein YurZ
VIGRPAFCLDRTRVLESRYFHTKDGPIMSSNPPGGVSASFQVFFAEAGGHAQAWMAAVQGLDQASALDQKTGELAYLAVLAAMRMESGIPFHVKSAKQAGATRDEVISAILVGMPAAGQGVIQYLPAAIAAYDGK